MTVPLDATAANLSPGCPATLVCDTAGLAPLERARHWTDVIAASYFPLELTFREPERFSGRLTRWTLGDVAVSRLRSDALFYRRGKRHLREAGEEAFLITIPRTQPVRFVQMGREVECRPGAFVIERGNAPYTFSYDRASDLIAVKVLEPTLAAHLSKPGRFCALDFDASSGVGALMVDMVRATEAHWATTLSGGRDALGRHLLELLVLAIENDPRAIESGGAAIAAAHLSRVGRMIAERYGDPGLAPGDIARACGISKRYLHALCRADGATVGERLREARLSAARANLSHTKGTRSITDIAYGCGFSDGSQFSRAYRARFGETPRETRASARGAAHRTSCGDTYG